MNPGLKLVNSFGVPSQHSNAEGVAPEGLGHLEPAKALATRTPEALATRTPEGFHPNAEALATRTPEGFHPNAEGVCQLQPRVSYPGISHRPKTQL
jgi:hypothetical protein